MFALIRRLLPILIGLLLIAVAIWYAGPYFAFADYRPLESETARGIAIACVVALWAAIVLFRRLRAKRAGEKLVTAVVQQSAAKDLPSADVIQLRERFKEAAEALKRAPGGSRGLYDLPWYVFIGAPGSGKSTLLVNSGLNFPLEERTGRHALRGIGGTRNCDWWFTNEAVFLDTAGRYMTQDSDPAADSEAWSEFLSLLKQYRKRRPLNGVILTVSVQDLLQREGSSDRYIDAVRRRLNELNDQLGIPLPVYVMVTKCDLVAGFTEHFDDLTHDGRAQVWGVTFPYEKTVAGEAAPLLRPEFDRLVARLNERVFARVDDERDATRRALAFAFPQQLALLGDQLVEVVRGVISTSRFERQVLLRGVYFTSGTQEGTPIDRLLGSLGRVRGAQAPAPSGKGKAYFVERLLKQVLFAESGLAGVNRRFEAQMAAAQLGAYAAIALAVVVALGLWTVSYSKNRTYIGSVSAAAGRLKDVPPLPASASLDEFVPRLDVLRAVVDTADRYREGTPWSMRWGLFQGGGLGDAARDAYSRELSGALLPHIASRFRQRVLEYATEPENLYVYLRAYLMLGDPSHLDNEQLALLADQEWKETYANDPDRAEQMIRHFKSLLEYQMPLRPVPIDQEIVAQARNTLKQASLAGLMYRYIRISYANDDEHVLHLDVEAGLRAKEVLELQGRPLDQPMPAIFTKPVFQRIVMEGTDALIARLAGEFWVWGDARPTFTAVAKLRQEFFNVYEDEYIRAWDAVLNGIRPRPASSLDRTKESLAILAGETSPLRGLLKKIDENTFLTPPPEPSKPGIKIPDLPAIGRGLLNRGQSTSVPGARVTAHFDAIHRLVSGQNPPIEVVIRKIQELQQKVALLGNDVGNLPPGDKQSIGGVGQTAQDLKREAAPLPRSVATVVEQVADGAIHAVTRIASGDLSRRYRQEVLGACMEVVKGGYPFTSAGTADVTPGDFGRLFGYGGVYDAFFKRELVDLVDTSKDPWVWRTDASGSRVGGDANMLREFEVVDRIRKLYFRSGAQEPELRFTITSESLDDQSSRFTLVVDGQTVDDQHQAPRPVRMAWPGPQPGQVVATFYEKSGAGRPHLAFEGPWAWQRLLESARLERLSDVKFRMTISTGGHRAQLLLEAPTVLNPYANNDLGGFGCQ